MPAPVTPLPLQLPTLHLYRHILREVSYLPPAWSHTISHAVRRRFRKHQHSGPGRDEGHAVRQKNRHARATTLLRKLRAANHGDKDAMDTFIQYGFGRIGPRKWALFQKLVSPEVPAANNEEELKALLANHDAERAASGPQDVAAHVKARPDRNQLAKFDNYSPGKDGRPNNRAYETWDQKKLMLLLQSQRRMEKERSDVGSSKKLKNLDQDVFVPDRTVWGRAPIVGAIRGKRDKFWTSVANKARLPVRPSEWNMLSKLSRGAQEQGDWAVPPRRTPATLLSTGTNSSSLPASLDWHWEDAAGQRSAVAERHTSSRASARTGQVGTGPYQSRNRGGQPPSARWFRRAYERTWRLTPKIVQDPQSLKTSITWGPGKSNLCAPTAEQLAFFEGVDGQGGKPRERKPPPAAKREAAAAVPASTPSSSSSTPDKNKTKNEAKAV